MAAVILCKIGALSQADLTCQACRKAVELADAADAGVEVASASILPSHEVLGPLVEPDRGPRLHVTAGLPISDYSLAELEALGRWLNSDNLLRTDDELLREMRQELGFQSGRFPDQCCYSGGCRCCPGTVRIADLRLRSVQ